MAHSATGRSIPLISPAEGVSEEMIRQLVETFYDRVIRDPELGPIFHKELSGRWSMHLKLMVDGFPCTCFGMVIQKNMDGA